MSEILGVWMFGFLGVSFLVVSFLVVLFSVVSFFGVLERNSMNRLGEVRSGNTTGTPSRDSAHGEAELTQVMIPR